MTAIGKTGHSMSENVGRERTGIGHSRSWFWAATSDLISVIPKRLKNADFVLEVSVHVSATALQLLTHLGYLAAGYITPGVSSDVQIREP